MAMVYTAVRDFLKAKKMAFHEVFMRPDPAWDDSRKATEALLPEMLKLIKTLQFKRPSARAMALTLKQQVAHMCAPRVPQLRQKMFTTIASCTRLKAHIIGITQFNGDLHTAAHGESRPTLCGDLYRTH